MSDAERLNYLVSVLPSRQVQRHGFEHRLIERDQLSRVLHPLESSPPEPACNHEDLPGLAQASAEAAVLVGLLPRCDGTRVLLTRRNDSLRHHGGQVSFPGGRVEPSDADAVSAAIRESAEEIALDSTQVCALGYLDPLVTVSGFRVTPVVAVIDPGFVAVPQPDEVAEVFEVPLAYLMAPDNLRRIEIEFRGRPRHVFEYAWPGQRIWGATAAILFNLRRRLEGDA